MPTITNPLQIIAKSKYMYLAMLSREVKISKWLISRPIQSQRSIIEKTPQEMKLFEEYKYWLSQDGAVPKGVIKQFKEDVKSLEQKNQNPL
ncbi:hypothetical protein [Flavobacterium algicola]|uniref:hypothetical protein n=1 Tax=Flavobacterium algicola TaxID=556529 RepID=UPI001EFC35FA|nr:hypothetical protein [Flavobacterium algicola]MCG9792468.1 hypothetical protein [Flavobacterium algicola]